jgi:hypothetical protein
MSALTRLALEVLQSVSTQPGLRAVACATLLAAMDQMVDVPNETHMAVWTYLLGSDASAATMHHHLLSHPDVAREALRVLSHVDAGEGAQDLAMAVMRGPNVAEVREQDLVSLADRVLDEGRVRRVSWLLEQVHEQRGLTPAFIAMLRDRLASSTDAGVRVGGVTVGALLPRLDEHFAARMFLDSSPLVRTAVADLLDGASQLDREKALVLIRDQLRTETHRSTLSALYFALGTLVRTGARPTQHLESPDGTH